MTIDFWEWSNLLPHLEDEMTAEIMAAYHKAMNDWDSDIPTVRKEAAIALVQVVNAKRHPLTAERCYVCGASTHHYVETDGFEFPICPPCQRTHGGRRQWQNE